jgi:Ras-related protein Rab-5C
MKTSLKIVLIGASSVGKTSIASSFILNKLDKTEESTLGVSYFTRTLDGCKLQIWDTAGQERFRSLTPMYIRGSDMIIAIYDGTDIKTYDDLINYWIPYVKTIEPDANFYIVESKIDMLDSNINTEVAKKYAKDNGYLFWRVSARESINIQEMFSDIVSKSKTKEMNTSSNIIVSSEKQKKFCCY